MAEANGFYYMRARYYDSSVGRFIAEDPAGFGAGDVNLMTYVQNNPVNGIDPLGLWTLQIGLNGTGGGGAGATYERGIAIGVSNWKFQFGTYRTYGGGGYGGVGGSGSVNVSVSANQNINQLNGRSGSVGASADVGLSIGGGVSINEGARPSYSGSIGLGGGPAPVEVHGFITTTTVNDWGHPGQK